MSKLGLVINGTVDTRVTDFLRRTKPAIVRFVDDFSLARSLRQQSPITVLVGRVSAPQPTEGDPAEAARSWVKAQLDTCLAHPDIDYWEGYHELWVGSAERVSWFAALESERVRSMAEHGLKACIGNFSTGTPELDHRWEAFLPAVETAIEHGGILGLHEFSAPFMQFAFGSHQANPESNQGDEGWLTGRYRKVWRQFLQPKGLEIPIAITAGGIDGNALADVPWRPANSIRGGWRAFRDWWREQGHEDAEAYYLEQLAWYDREIGRDEYVIGMAIYMVGEDADSFDLAGPLLDKLGDTMVEAEAPAEVAYRPEPTQPKATISLPEEYNARYLLYAQGMHPSALQATWKYLLAYQVTQGQSFHDAVRLCQDERDVISVVNPNLEQIVWLKRHTRANLDILHATDIRQLSLIMNRRVANNQRFGPPWSAGPDELRLKWPLLHQPHLIIQAFGANPERYGQAPGDTRQLHGHEGWDIPAPHGSEVVAAAAGVVLRLDDNPDSWPYGRMARLEHRLPNGDTYQTVYAHLDQLTVNLGDGVEAGQPIGATGGSGQCNLPDDAGAYLHFHLQWIGATQRGHRDPWGRVWPRNLIWPGEKMIDAYSYQPGAEPPPTSDLQQYAGPIWERQVALIGVHYRSSGRLEPAAYTALETAHVEAVKLPSSSNPRNVDELRRQLDDPFILIQLVASFWQDGAPRAFTPADFSRQLLPAIEPFYQRGARYYEIHHQPNLPQQGLGATWINGAEYGTWWIAVRDLLAPHFPEARWGFPGLNLMGGNEMWSFLSQAKAAVQAADWVGLNLYWETLEERNDQIINSLGEYRRRWPNKLLFVTEFSNIAPDVPSEVKEEQYLEFYQIVRKIPGLAAAFQPDEGQWTQNDAPTNMAVKLGNRTF